MIVGWGGWDSFNMHFTSEQCPHFSHLSLLILRQRRQIACRDNSEVGVYPVTMSAV